MSRQSQNILQPYITAKLDYLPETFTLGDEKKYNGYYNKLLTGQQQYRFFVLADLTEQESVSNNIQVYTASRKNIQRLTNVLGQVSEKREEHPAPWGALTLFFSLSSLLVNFFETGVRSFKLDSFFMLKSQPGHWNSLRCEKLIKNNKEPHKQATYLQSNLISFFFFFL